MLAFAGYTLFILINFNHILININGKLSQMQYMKLWLFRRRYTSQMKK